MINNLDRKCQSRLSARCIDATPFAIMPYAKWTFPPESSIKIQYNVPPTYLVELGDSGPGMSHPIFHPIMPNACLGPTS
jgi:hypothetical protein